MELIRIQKHNMFKYASFLPDFALRNQGDIFVCVKEENPCGAIVLEDLERSLGISWLWVEPEMRRMKIGASLLAKAYQFAMQQHYTALTVAYDPEESWAPILEYMLAKMGFQLLMSPFTQYYISSEELLASPLMNKYRRQEASLSLSQALGSLSPKDLIKIQMQCREDKNLLLSSIDFSKADPQKTRLLYQENKIKGLTLVNFTNTLGEYELALVYLDPSYTAMGPTLFRETVAELLKDTGTILKLRFTCVTDISVRLADALLGKTGKNIKQMCHGILEMPF